MTVFDSGGLTETQEFSPGDVAYVPQGYGHYIENIGTEDCLFLLVFNNGEYQDIDFSTWLAGSPPDVVATNFGVPRKIIEAFPKRDAFITGKG
jgi:oxalate decarboxylase